MESIPKITIRHDSDGSDEGDANSDNGNVEPFGTIGHALAAYESRKQPREFLFRDACLFRVDGELKQRKSNRKLNRNLSFDDLAKAFSTSYSNVFPKADSVLDRDQDVGQRLKRNYVVGAMESHPSFPFSIFNVRQRRVIKIVQAHESSIRTIAIDESRGALFSGTVDGDAKMFDFSALEEMRTWKAVQGRTRFLRPSFGTQLLKSSGVTHMLIIDGKVHTSGLDGLVILEPALFLHDSNDQSQNEVIREPSSL